MHRRLLAFIFCLVTPAILLAQGGATGAICGTVQDQSSALVPKAQVEITGVFDPAKIPAASQASPSRFATCPLQSNTLVRYRHLLVRYPKAGLASEFRGIERPT